MTARPRINRDFEPGAGPNADMDPDVVDVKVDAKVDVKGRGDSAEKQEAAERLRGYISKAEAEARQAKADLDKIMAGEIGAGEPIKLADGEGEKVTELKKEVERAVDKTRIHKLTGDRDDDLDALNEYWDESLKKDKAETTECDLELYRGLVKHGSVQNKDTKKYTNVSAEGQKRFDDLEGPAITKAVVASMATGEIPWTTNGLFAAIGMVQADKSPITGKRYGAEPKKPDADVIDIKTGKKILAGAIAGAALGAALAGAGRDHEPQRNIASEREQTAKELETALGEAHDIDNDAAILSELTNLPVDRERLLTISRNMAMIAEYFKLIDNPSISDKDFYATTIEPGLAKKGKERDLFIETALTNATKQCGKLKEDAIKRVNDLQAKLDGLDHELAQLDPIEYSVMDTGGSDPDKAEGFRDSEDDIDLEPKKDAALYAKAKETAMRYGETLLENREKVLAHTAGMNAAAAETAVRELEQMDAQAYAAHLLKIGMKQVGINMLKESDLERLKNREISDAKSRREKLLKEELGKTQKASVPDGKTAVRAPNKLDLILVRGLDIARKMLGHEKPPEPDEVDRAAQEEARAEKELAEKLKAAEKAAQEAAAKLAAAAVKPLKTPDGGEAKKEVAAKILEAVRKNIADRAAKREALDVAKLNELHRELIFSELPKEQAKILVDDEYLKEDEVKALSDDELKSLGKEVAHAYWEAIRKKNGKGEKSVPGSSLDKTAEIKPRLKMLQDLEQYLIKVGDKAHATVTADKVDDLKAEIRKINGFDPNEYRYHLDILKLPEVDVSVLSTDELSRLRDVELAKKMSTLGRAEVLKENEELKPADALKTAKEDAETLILNLKQEPDKEEIHILLADINANAEALPKMIKTGLEAAGVSDEVIAKIPKAKIRRLNQRFIDELTGLDK
jgi:hypothetical protein